MEKTNATDSSSNTDNYRSEADDLRDRLRGCLIGLAIGDALGLPYEGINPKRAQRLLGPSDRYRFVFGRGMISDDTEHSCMVLQAYMEATSCDRDEADDSRLKRFERAFARRLRWWFLALPAGVGKATAISCLKLWLGIRPSHVHSAGNGPAMRAPVLAAAIDDLGRLKRLVQSSTLLTHGDRKAVYGAWAIALATWSSKRRQSDPNQFIDAWKEFSLDETADDAKAEFDDLLTQVIDSVVAGESTQAFCLRQGWSRGVSGYALQTVPAAIHCWLSFPNDYRAAIRTMIECGGDADTTAAIVGGIVGASVGESGLPVELQQSYCDWPRSLGFLRRLADCVVEANERNSNCADTQATRVAKPKIPETNLLFVLPRNLFFLSVVLFHGFRRLLPPY